MRIGIVGVGHIGTVIAAELGNRGHEIVAVDLDTVKIDNLRLGIPPISEPGLKELVLKANSLGKMLYTCNFSDLKQCEMILVAVGTPLGVEGPNLTPLFSACEQINSIVNNDCTVVIKSTVPPGTTKKIASEVLGRANFRVAFVPERLAEGSAIGEFRSLPMVIGGQTPSDSKYISQLWEELGFETIIVSDSTAAELVKLADNAWIDLNIAFGQELAKVCDVLQTDVLSVISAANTLKKGSSFVNILTPSVGVGGYCLTKDPYFLHDFARGIGVEISLSYSSRKINEGAPMYLFMRALGLLDQSKQNTMLVVGIAFKNNTGDVRNSPAIEFIRIAQSFGISVKWYDPMVLQEDLPDELRSIRLNDLPNEKFDLLANLAAHDNYTKVDIDFCLRFLQNDGIFIDGRRFMNAFEIESLKKIGIRYVGAGRGKSE